MTTSAQRLRPGRGGRRRDDQQQPADVFVIFGITGDLAKVMTFRSLYRLEARGLLDCPIVGVAVDDWNVERAARARARAASRAPASRSTRRCSTGWPSGSPTSRATSATPATYARVADAIKGAEHPVFYLEIPPFLFGTRGQGPGRGRA